MEKREKELEEERERDGEAYHVFPWFLRPTFESKRAPPFTIRPNYPSGNPFHPSLAFSRYFTTANYTYLRPRLGEAESRDSILVNSSLFRLYDGRNKGPRGRRFSSSSLPLSSLPASPSIEWSDQSISG